MSIIELSPIRRRDPFLERERKRYEKPLPSREYVLQLLEERGVPLPFERIVAELDVQPHEHEDFTRRLGAMMRDGQIIQNRKGDWLIPDKADLIRGRIEGHPDGYGFLVPDDGGGDLFIGEREMAKVLHGDRALARVVGVDRRGRREGKIVEVILGATTAHVRIDVGGGSIITASITNEAVNELGLAAGQEAYAVVKASDVMIAVD